MRKQIAALVLVGFLFGQANLLELTKLPALAAHFFAHQNENSELGFFEFIHAHYCHEHYHCSEHESDRSLPFQSCDFHLVHMVIQAHAVLDLAVVKLEDLVVHSSCYVAPNIMNRAAEIWQPPKI